MKDFEKIYLEYYNVVYAYILSVCRNEYLAEEITQETFFKAIKSINTFRGECKISVWLCQIAKNTYYTDIKRRERQIDAPQEFIQYTESIEKTLIDKESVANLHLALHSLKEPYKEVFWMRTFGDLSFKEIGEIFEKTESWARVTYHRAKIKIKEDIQ